MEKVIYNRTGDKVGVLKSLIDGAGRIGEFQDYYLYLYDLQTTIALRNLGIPVKPPIHSHYRWSGKYTPLKHQVTTAAFLTLHRRAFCLNGLGSGKTLSALWAADYLLSIGEVNRVLVLSPLSTLKSVWWETVFQHFIHLSPFILHGINAAGIRKKHRELERAKVLIVNHEFVKSGQARHFMPTGEIGSDLLIVDEGSMFREATTEKYRALRKFTDKSKLAWWMTATPTPNRPTDAWAQAAAMGTVKMRFSEFKELTMMKVSEYKWVPRPGAEQAVKQILSPYIRFATEDCIDLPGISYEHRTVEMSVDQKKMYAQLKKEAVLMLEGGSVVTAVNEAVKAGKLLQIACGCVYDEAGNTVEIRDNRKTHELRSVVEEAGGSPVIVFAPFKSVVRHIAEKMKDFHPAVVTGDTPIGERNRIIENFQAGKVRLLIAHPKTMSHGLTLHKSSVICWYAPLYSNDIYEQANGRIYRTGQTKHCTIIHLSSSEVEDSMYKILRERGQMQGSVLRLLAGRG